MATVWHNNNVALTKDLIFGVCVMSEEGWVPIGEGSIEELELVLRLIDFNPLCPKEWIRAIQNVLMIKKSELVPS